MRVNGYLTSWSSEEGLTPVDVQDIEFFATPEELRLLAKFFAEAADEMESALSEKHDFRRSIDFPDDKPNPQTPICVDVVAYAT
jgi:hypothetical protein